MSVIAELMRHPQRFDFIQLIRLLRHHGRDQDLRLLAEPVPVGMATEVRALEGDEVRLGVEALSGAKGVLPDYLQEAMLIQLYRDEHALQAFLDVLNQRYYRLLQAALERSSLLLREEQEQCADSALTRRMYQHHSLKQLAALGNQQQELFEYSLLLGLKSRNLNGLKQLLSGYFGVGIALKTNLEKRYRLEADSCTRLGIREGQNQTLGQGSLLGRTARLQYQTLEIHIIPATHEEYVRIQNDEQFAQAVRELTGVYLRDPVDLRLYLYVRRAFIKRPTISAKAGQPLRLGEGNCLAPERKPEEYRKILLH